MKKKPAKIETSVLSARVPRDRYLAFAAKLKAEGKTVKQWVLEQMPK